MNEHAQCDTVVTHRLVDSHSTYSQIGAKIFCMYYILIVPEHVLLITVKPSMFAAIKFNVFEGQVISLPLNVQFVSA